MLLEMPVQSENYVPPGQEDEDGARDFQLFNVFDQCLKLKLNISRISENWYVKLNPKFE